MLRFGADTVRLPGVPALIAFAHGQFVSQLTGLLEHFEFFLATAPLNPSRADIRATYPADGIAKSGNNLGNR